MLSLLSAFGFAFAACLLLVPPVTRLARFARLVDAPDGRRKIHTRPVPLAGGIAIFAALSVSLGAARLGSAAVAEWIEASTLSLPGLFASAAILCAVGIADDRFRLRGRHKLLGQLAAVGVMIAAGGPVETVDLFGWAIPLGPLAVPFTAFWLLAAINSLNLIDGMDGMVGCVGGITAAVLAVMSLWAGQLAAALVALTLAGAVAGFLCYNLPPARIYLGDCGSMLIGLIVGVLALHSALKGPATVMMTIPAVLLAIPILDTTAAVARRTLTGRSIYTTDRGHLHHCLLRSGLSRRRVLVLVSLMCLLTGLGALGSLALHRQLLAATAAAAVIGILVVTRLFGHAELVLLRTKLTALALAARYGRQEGRTHETCVRLQGSADWQQFWQTLTQTAARLRLASVCLDVNAPLLHEGYHARWDRLGGAADDAQAWKVEIPLSLQGRSIGRLEINGPRDAVPVAEKIAVLSRIAEDVEQAVGRLADGLAPTAWAENPESGQAPGTGLDMVRPA